MKKILLIILLFSAGAAFGQNGDALNKYRSDDKGNWDYRKEGILNGNQIKTLFNNRAEVGHWPYSPSVEWPKGVPHNYVDGTALLVGSILKTDNGDQPSVATAYREHVDKDNATGIPWTFMPLPGYVNSKSESPAINTDIKTWPLKWPRAIPEIDDSWDGKWYGYFGKGVQNSDAETFFVMDDSQDREYYIAPYNYKPSPTIDPTRGGMGLRVEVRGFQWSHVLAEDIIFWHYDIMNIAEKDLSEVYFGFYSDLGVGSYNRQGASKNNAFYDKKLDLVYGWDEDGISILDKGKLGYVGYAYLESPGNSTNGIDDDEDGILDETRDNDAGAFISGPVGIYGNPKDHWQGDEDGDWLSYVDVNGNGKWDSDQNEPLNNDVGTDGIGPFDVGYVSPDPDGTEGNGMPNQGEPNFGKTDKDESDQIGLTSLSLYSLIQDGVGPGWPRHDPGMYEKLSSGYLPDEISVLIANIQMVFSSGPFPLNVGKRERFSVAIALGDNLGDLIFNKETVQSIYNANYNFSKPPIKPTLTAVPGDGKVYLYWNKIAESSRDQFLGLDPDSLGYKKDFEGYLLYRSTEAAFSQVKLITDMNGDAKYWKPLKQWDLIDTIAGADPVGINGASFNRGSNTGIQNSYIDTDVKNGMTYYYALCAYDKGDPNYGTAGLQPTENTKIITEDLAGLLTYVDQNCAVVTPNAPAAGYKSPYIQNLNIDGGGTGPVSVSILNPSEIQENAKYEAVFHSTPLTSKGTGYIPGFRTISYDIVRTVGTTVDTILTDVDSTTFGEGKLGNPFDGLALTVTIPIDSVIVDSLTGWTIGNSNLSMAVTGSGTTPAGNNKKYWPGDYEINFTGEKTNPSTGRTIPTQDDTYPFDNGFKVNFTVKNTLTGEQLLPFVYDNNGDGVFSVGDDFAIVEYEDINNNGILEWNDRRNTWKISYTQGPGTSTIAEPVAGDQFVIKTTKPFFEGDKISFIAKAAKVDAGLANTQLNKINVVPNPYIGAAGWERKSAYSTGHGERKIDFINLPSSCTIRIFTIAGALVKTIVKESSPMDGAISWNLVSDDGMDIAYGLYVYHVDAPGIGEYIGKFAVIK